MASDPVRLTTLSWGVKQSFRGYVEATGGVIETGAGAERDVDGGFIFVAAPGEGLTLGDDGRPQGQARFTGEVRFEAHGGMLKVCLADPILDIGPTGAALTAFDTPARTHRMEIAKLDLAAITQGDAGELVIPASLAMDGIQVLGDHYPLGAPLDPVRLAPQSEG
ncbi:MAG: cell wall anchor protein [Phenylobacterium sp.]|jgi:hypothetical protein|nr:cell wall anchor protein [Phenylobacterium sp.]